MITLRPLTLCEHSAVVDPLRSRCGGWPSAITLRPLTLCDHSAVVVGPTRSLYCRWPSAFTLWPLWSLCGVWPSVITAAAVVITVRPLTLGDHSAAAVAVPTSCSDERRAAQADARKNPSGGIFIPVCLSEKLYRAEQCQLARDICWCVDKVTGKPLRSSAPSQELLNCTLSKQKTFKGGWLGGRVSEWASERVSEWASGRVGEWGSERVGEWASGRVGGWLGGRVAEWPSGRAGERAIGRAGERASGRVGERASGRVGEWASGRVGEWASGRVGQRASGRVAEWLLIGAVSTLWRASRRCDMTPLTLCGQMKAGSRCTKIWDGPAAWGNPNYVSCIGCWIGWPRWPIQMT